MYSFHLYPDGTRWAREPWKVLAVIGHLFARDAGPCRCLSLLLASLSLRTSCKWRNGNALSYSHRTCRRTVGLQNGFALPVLFIVSIFPDPEPLELFCPVFPRLTTRSLTACLCESLTEMCHSESRCKYTSSFTIPPELPLSRSVFLSATHQHTHTHANDAWFDSG